MAAAAFANKNKAAPHGSKIGRRSSSGRALPACGPRSRRSGSSMLAPRVWEAGAVTPRGPALSRWC